MKEIGYVMAILTAGLIIATGRPAIGAVTLSNGNERCAVQTSRYLLRINIGESQSEDRVSLFELLSPKGNILFASLTALDLFRDNRAYTSRGSSCRPHLHTLRSGPYLAEMYLENVIMKEPGSAGNDWSGLAEVGLICHEDRVFIIIRYICQKGGWILGDQRNFVYEAAEGHRSCPAQRVEQCSALIQWGTDRIRMLHDDIRGIMECDGVPVAYRTIPDDRGTLAIDFNPDKPHSLSFVSVPATSDWTPGFTHSFGFMLALAETTRQAEAILDDMEHPLAEDAIITTKGEFLGYDPLRGVYAFTAETSGTPDPPPGLRAGTRFTVRNDSRRRHILIDQKDPWGGITGGIIRNGDGHPMPITPQFGLNFPELREHGESGWATLTYPLELAPDQVRQVWGEHLYKSATDRQLIYLTTLENVGEPLLLQTTVATEAHTLTTGPYSGELKFGNELRVNDFRRIASQIKVRSVSAVLPVFFGYYDEDGVYRGLMPGAVHIRETGPFLIDYTVEAHSTDGLVSGQVHIWQAAHADMTRIFTRIDLQVKREALLDSRKSAPLFFLRHHCFNPMAFRKFAYTDADGAVAVGDLDFAPAIVVNGVPLGVNPLVYVYRASNAIDQGIPCSDITGNPGFVLLDWDVRFGDQDIQPGIYAFSTGANDAEQGDYARDVAIVPVKRQETIPAGSTIRYSAVQMVSGDNSSEPNIMELERDYWVLRPLRVAVSIGEVVSQWPPEARASDNQVECQLSGGTDWVPLRVSGFDLPGPLHVERKVGESWEELGPGTPGEAWYNVWPVNDGSFGYTFLIKTDPKGRTVQLRVSVDH
jgi:hypothetical protein